MENNNSYDCDCDGEQAHDIGEYVCENCRSIVTVCLGCYMIITVCSCGHCDEGDTLVES